MIACFVYTFTHTAQVLEVDGVFLLDAWLNGSTHKVVNMTKQLDLYVTGRLHWQSHEDGWKKKTSEFTWR